MNKDFQLKRILVGLDLTDMDEVLIRFTAYMAKIFQADQIYFLYVAEDLDMPKEIQEKYPNLLAPVDENLHHHLHDKIAEGFSSLPDIGAHIDVREGKGTQSLLKYAKQKDVDLIVMGRKMSLPGKGILPQKVARMAHRSVLLVPEKLPETLDRLIVPIDFSKNSEMALKQALEIKETSPLPVHISALHVYDLPSGWHSTGKSIEEFADIMERNARNDYAQFLRKMGLSAEDTPAYFIRDNNHDPVSEIYDAAIANDADLIILGSRGKSEAATFLMGSTAERLAMKDKSIPLLIVKDKNENLDFLDALLRI